MIHGDSQLKQKYWIQVTNADRSNVSDMQTTNKKYGKRTVIIILWKMSNLIE